MGLSVTLHAQTPDTIISLYTGEIPCARAGEAVVEHNPDLGRFYKNVTDPELHVFRPLGKTKTGAAMLVIPGGGYYLSAYDWEGREPAELLAQHGITVFVLLHRLPHWETGFCKSEVALMDAEQAMVRIRLLAAEWGLDGDRVGIMGASAGGHLAGSVSVHHGEGEAASTRPDLTVLLYPVISMDPELGAHAGSRRNLLGEEVDPDKEQFYDLPLHVYAGTPPAFLVHATNDTVVPPINSIRYYRALADAGGSADLHLFNSGGHGFGLARQEAGSVRGWSELLLDWLRQHDFIRNGKPGR